MNIQKIREDSSILSHTVCSKPLVCSDNDVTTQKPCLVADVLVGEYYPANANVHRGVCYLSQQATELHEASRETVRQFINARGTNEVVFTRGTTGSISLFVSSFGDEFMEEGDEVILPAMGHHSNIVPWQLLAVRRGIAIKVTPMNDKDELLPDEYEKLLSEWTKIVSVIHISNVLGAVNPVKEVAATVHAHGIPCLVDTTQSILYMKADVQELGADLLAFSAHKIYGPTGVGVPCGKEEWLDHPPSYQGGGEMIQHVSFEKATFNELPFKLKAGTPSYIGTTELVKAFDYVNGHGLERIAVHECELTTYALRWLEEAPRMRIFGETTEREIVVSFLIGDIHHFDLGTLLDRLGIAAKTRHHCAQPLMQRLGTEGTIRASFAIYDMKSEIDTLVAEIERISKTFQ